MSNPRSSRSARRASTPVQPLETRRLMSTVASPEILIASPAIEMSPAATVTTVSGLTPAQVRHAYGFDTVTFNGGKTVGDGAGQTIAIVDAYNAPTIAADLKVFDAKFGLANPTLTIVNQTGGSALPATNAGWAQEISLDVEWAHAIAPAARILLVEAKSASTTDLLAAVNYARSVTGVSTVSMSFGSSEFSGQTSYDSYFTTTSSHTGVTFIAASGDSGSASGAMWPAGSANVLSVGGTTLYTSGTAATYSSETGWSYSGGGQSRYSAEPSYQSKVNALGVRTVPDVAYNSNPSTGFAVYDSTSYAGSSGWMVFGGTSAAAPQWAGLIAIANQGRSISKLSALDGRTNTMPALYSLFSTAASTYFHDVTTGSSSRSISAAAGYDMVTGLGSPKAASLIAALVKSTITTAAATITGSLTSTTGGGHHHGFAVTATTAFSPTVSAEKSIICRPSDAVSTTWIDAQQTFYIAGAAVNSETAGEVILTGVVPQMTFTGVTPALTLTPDVAASIDSPSTEFAAAESPSPAFSANLTTAVSVTELTTAFVPTGDTFVGRFAQATGWKWATGAVAAVALVVAMKDRTDQRTSVFGDVRVMVDNFDPTAA